MNIGGSSYDENSSKRLVWVLSIGAVIIAAAIIATLVYFLHKENVNSQTQQSGASLTVGQYPYVYPCSVATLSNFESVFGLSGGTIGYRYENSAYSGASGDLTQIAPNANQSEGYVSNCNLTVPQNPTAATETSINVTITQFSSSKGANDSLNSDQLAASSLTNNPNASPPTLPSFTTNSVVTAPTPPNNTLEASVAQGNLYVTLDYNLQGSDTVASITPKLDAFAKTIMANIGNKKLATEPNDITGQATFLNTPFVDVCKNLGLSKLSSIFSGVEFRPDSVTNDSQYGAPVGSQAASNGVVSSCGLTFSTTADRAGFRAFNSSPDAQALELQNIYPESLRLSMNTYATPAAAQAAWSAKKTAQAAATATGPTSVQALSNLGDEAYTYHGESLFQKSAIDQSKGTSQVSYKITEDDYVIVDGPHLITISFQQNSESDPYVTGPLTITTNQIQATYQLFKDMLAKQ